MSDRLATAIAETVHATRVARGLGVSALAQRSGVSRAMIAKIERGDAQPTAALLGRLSAALGMTLSELVARAEGAGGRLARRADQPTWADPDTGYVRRAVSPAGSPVELVEVELPPGTRVSFAADSYAFIQQLIWVLDGRLHLREGDVEHELDAGDCLQLGPPADCTFRNPTRKPCRYLVALTKRVM
jgi:transcriptional regulator with XRE-family HTH domain